MLKCQVFAYESETFHRRRPNGISHCQNEDKNSKASPSPCTTWTTNASDYRTAHAPPQTAASTVEALSHTYAVKSPLVTMANPKFTPKSTSSRGPIAKPHYLPHPRTVRPMMPNGIRIRSAVFPQCTGQTDLPTHVRTYDRQIVHGKV